MMHTVSHSIAALLCIAMLSSLTELFLTKDAMKKTLRVITAAGLILIVLSPLQQLDMAVYASELRREKIESPWDADAAAEQNRMLNRMLIESECSAYILDKGKSLNLPIVQAHVALRWDTEGYWVPDHAQIVMEAETEGYKQLQDIITADLGIPPEAQEWSTVREE